MPETRSIWQSFGFRDNPYFVEPLDVSNQSEDLFTRRDEESAEFLSLVDCQQGCVVIVSGDAGIGKTSFVNIQQQLLVTGRTGLGPRLLPCLERTALSADDNTVSLAQRIVSNALTDIASFCKAEGKNIPSEAGQARKWLSYKGATDGYQMGFASASWGRSRTIPPPSEANLEAWCAILEAIAVEARAQLDVSGIVVCLENTETIPFDRFVEFLLAYRDTLFSTRYVWWILIGQARLYAEIARRNRRIAERIRGTGIDLRSFTGAEFHDVIERRVQVFRSAEEAVSPLSEHIHAMLFDAAKGEVRFAIDVADTLVSKIVAWVRVEASKALGTQHADPEYVRRVLDTTLKKQLIDRRIPDQLALNVLKTLAARDLQNRRLEAAEIGKLSMIGSRRIDADFFAELGFETKEKAAAFLDSMWQAGVLGREATSKGEQYSLKGFTKLCFDFKLLTADVQSV